MPNWRPGVDRRQAVAVRGEGGRGHPGGGTIAGPVGVGVVGVGPGAGVAALVLEAVDLVVGVGDRPPVIGAGFDVAQLVIAGNCRPAEARQRAGRPTRGYRAW